MIIASAMQASLMTAKMFKLRVFWSFKGSYYAPFLQDATQVSGVPRMWLWSLLFIQLKF